MLVVLLCLALMAPASAVEGRELLYEMETANTMASLLANHTAVAAVAVEYTQADEAGEPLVIEEAYVQDADGNWAYYQVIEETYASGMYPDGAYYATDGMLFAVEYANPESYDAYYAYCIGERQMLTYREEEAVVSQTENDGVLEVVTETKGLTGMGESTLKSIYRVDAEAYTLLSVEQYQVGLDGVEVVLGEVTYRYDDAVTFTPPASVVHPEADVDTRTVTLVVDYGTAQEQTYTFTTPVTHALSPGDINMDAYDQYRDEALTEPYEATAEPPYADVTLYMVRK